MINMFSPMYQNDKHGHLCINMQHQSSNFVQTCKSCHMLSKLAATTSLIYLFLNMWKIDNDMDLLMWPVKEYKRHNWNSLLHPFFSRTTKTHLQALQSFQGYCFQLHNILFDVGSLLHLHIHLVYDLFIPLTINLWVKPIKCTTLIPRPLQ